MPQRPSIKARLVFLCTSLGRGATHGHFKVSIDSRTRIVIEMDVAAEAKAHKKRVMKDLPRMQRLGYKVDNARRPLQFLLLTLLALLYPKAINKVTSTLNCLQKEVSVATYRTMLGDGGALRAAGIPTTPWAPRRYFSRTASTNPLAMPTGQRWAGLSLRGAAAGR